MAFKKIPQQVFSTSLLNSLRLFLFIFVYKINLLKPRKMPKRTSINDVKAIDDLNNLQEIVKDKRNDKRADAKKKRRNRHYVKLLIKQQISREEAEE
jgi:hypothetical protein